MVARQPHKLKVGGSSPPSATKSCGGQALKTTFWEIPEENKISYLGVDKWALSSCLMCHLYDGFVGSNPTLSTSFFLIVNDFFVVGH